MERMKWRKHLFTLLVTLLACVAACDCSTKKEGDTVAIEATAGDSVQEQSGNTSERPAGQSQPNLVIADGPENEPTLDCLGGSTAGGCSEIVRCETGRASWYGPGYHGRRAADGSRFNQWEMTAAHRTLPFGTVVVVNNLDNGLFTTVTITDRGPFIRGRIIDLSRKAAQDIDMIPRGTARVKICWEQN